MYWFPLLMSNSLSLSLSLPGTMNVIILVQVTLRLTVSQSWRPVPYGTHDHTVRLYGV